MSLSLRIATIPIHYANLIFFFAIDRAAAVENKSIPICAGIIEFTST